MEDEMVFRAAVWCGLGMAVGIFLWMWKNHNRVPYGRHHAKAAATTPLPFTFVMIPTRLAWSLMEIPPLLLSPPIFALGRNASLPVPRALALLFLAHYAHRSLLYPLRMRPTHTRNLPLLVFLAAILFNIYNTYIQMRSLSHFTHYPSSWLSSPQVFFGAILFIVGMIINISADSTLISLRKSDSSLVLLRESAASNSAANAVKAYKIPSGGLFEFVTCPNYFGELLEWFAWAIATWSLAGLVFFILSASNLVPRAIAHHQWYQENFTEYPRSRKILVPFIF